MYEEDRFQDVCRRGIGRAGRDRVIVGRASPSRRPDQTVLTIQCSIAAEQKALECKEEALKQLEACLAAAEASTAAGGTTTPAPAAVRRCNRDGLAALLKCQLVGLAGDGSCWTNPNPPTAAAGRK